MMDQDFTLTSELPPLKEHPIYIEGIALIEAGQWQQAYGSFQLLHSIYPDHTEVQEMFEDTRMRAALANFQPKHISNNPKPSRILRRFTIGIFVLIFIALAGYIAYEAWISPVLIRELRTRQVTSLRRTADEAVATGDFDRARQTLQLLQEILPQDIESSEMLRQIEQVEKLSTLYQQAKTLMAAGNWDQALEALTELESLDTEYRDLHTLIEITKESQTLETQFQTAEASFSDSDWKRAIAQYETLQQTDLTYKFEQVQSRLFESHLKYGQTLLAEAGQDQDRVTEALTHFSSALELRPIDDKALGERRLAETYLLALTSEGPDEMIKLLQTIYSERPDYGGQVVAQLLYHTALERGDSFLEVGNETAALTNYELAAQLLVEDSSEAQEKLTALTAQLESK